MSHVSPKRIYAVEENGALTDSTIAMIHAASPESVLVVLEQSDTDEDGRSQWLWVRLQNGDLILGVFPQGETYMAVEVDAATPREI